MTPQQIKIKTYFPVEVKLKMTKWELGFLTSLSKTNKEWSSRQKELLETLITKYELTAVPLPEKHIGMKRTNQIQYIRSKKSRKEQGIYNSSNTKARANKN
jgi:hypothetical protein